MQYETIKEFQGLDTLSESSDTGKRRLRRASNLMLRPVGGLKRIPPYQRLWGMLNLATTNSALGLTSGSGTCLLEIQNEGKVLLAFWDVANSKTLGIAYAEDTGAFSGDVTLTAGTAAVSVLATGLAANRRWYAYRFYDELWLGNGVDANLIYQYARTGLRLRKAGTDSVPATPSLATTAPSGSSTGWANDTKQIAVTYWDPGVNSLGYETALSAVASITLGTSAQDIRVTITGNTSGDLARFGYQRIYMRLPSAGTLAWQCLKEVANSSATHTLGTDLEVIQQYQADQKRTPPCTMFELFKGKLWCAGNVAQPSRVWVSKFARRDEIVPEGSDPEFYLDITGRPDEPDSPEISCLRPISETDIHIATQKTITAVDGTSFARNALTRVIAGPANPACISSWNDGSVPYLGRDGQLYAFRGAINGEGDFLAPEAVASLRSVVSISKLTREPWRANFVPDPVNNLLWIWVPASDNLLRGFIYDFLVKSLTGPFDYPKLSAVCQVGTSDGRFVGCDEGGNLFVFDTATDVTADPLGSNPAYTYYSPSYTPGAEHAGYGTITLADGKLLKAATSVMESPFFDFGAPNTRKGFFSLEWSTLRNARAVLAITIETDLGHTRQITYGDVHGRERHKVAFCMSGHAIKITVEATTAEDAPFAMRDITVGWEDQGPK